MKIRCPTRGDCKLEGPRSKRTFSQWTTVRILTTGLFTLLTLCASIGHAQSVDIGVLEQNKRLARGFYADLWFSNNTDRYDHYVAETYVVHDTGDRKNVTEPAIEQKHIADFFWENGTLSGTIQYQVAEGDLVATRWTSEFVPESLFGRLVIGPTTLSIINVLRYKDGKIVEFWNHRHDIDTSKTLFFVAKGLLIGLVIALLPLVWAIRLRRLLRLARVDQAARVSN